MTWIEFAIKMEREGEQFYRNLARKSTFNKGFVFIFNLLADEEAHHAATFVALRSQQKLPQSNIDLPEKLRTVFADFKDNLDMFNGLESELDLYTQALAIEKQSYSFYTAKAQEATYPNEKQILLKLAAEEERHVRLIGNLIELLRHPDNWVEDAEFGLRKEQF